MAWEFYDDSGNLKTTAAGTTVAILDDIQDVVLTSLADGALLRYDTTGPLWANTTSSTLLLTDAGQLQVPTTGSAAGILLGGDVNIWRSAANVVSTAGDLHVRNALADANPQVSLTRNGSTGGILSFGIGGATAVDVTLSRTAANVIAMGTGDKIQQDTLPSTANDLTNQVYVDRMNMFFA